MNVMRNNFYKEQMLIAGRKTAMKLGEKDLYSEDIEFRYREEESLNYYEYIMSLDNFLASSTNTLN